MEEIKISAKTPEKFEKLLSDILNMACVMCMTGDIPTQRDMENPQQTGRYWFLEESGERYQLFPVTNNYWMGIRERTDTSAVIQFRVRYDHERQKAKALTNSVLAFFPDNTEEAN